MKSLQELLQSLIDNEDLSITFRSAAVQELERLRQIEVLDEPQPKLNRRV